MKIYTDKMIKRFSSVKNRLILFLPCYTGFLIFTLLLVFKRASPNIFIVSGYIISAISMIAVFVFLSELDIKKMEKKIEENVKNWKW